MLHIGISVGTDIQIVIFTGKKNKMNTKKIVWSILLKISLSITTTIDKTIQNFMKSKTEINISTYTENNCLMNSTE